RTYGARENNQEELIPAYVQSQWELLKSAANIQAHSVQAPSQASQATTTRDSFHHHANLNTPNATEAPLENTKSHRFRPLTMLRRFID
ncbi:MAG TPA: hypothetical protein PLD88_12925, partial [Candidatus Berkiella sp.]|nr:hypothetical protein [Candidatus Berkiella sp.]